MFTTKYNVYQSLVVPILPMWMWNARVPYLPIERGEFRSSRTNAWGGCSGSRKENTNPMAVYEACHHSRSTVVTPILVTVKLVWFGHVKNCRRLKVPWRAVDAVMARLAYYGEEMDCASCVGLAHFHARQVGLVKTITSQGSVCGAPLIYIYIVKRSTIFVLYIYIWWAVGIHLPALIYTLVW